MKREKGIQQNEKCFRSSPDTANAKDHSLPFSMKLFVVRSKQTTTTQKKEN